MNPSAGSSRVHGPVAKDYKFGKQLGQGHIGVAMVCWDRKTGEQLVCKTMNKGALAKNTSDVNVDKEIQIMQALAGHRHVIDLKAVYEDSDNVHIIMEYCQEGDLFDELECKGRFTEREAAAVFCQVADAVARCHEAGIIHRDIKPENIFLRRKSGSEVATSSGANLPWDNSSSSYAGTSRGAAGGYDRSKAAAAAEDGAEGSEETPKRSWSRLLQQARLLSPSEVKLADFGLATYLDKEGHADGLAGSPYYVAPEVIEHSRSGPESDMWSLGVVLYGLLARSLPFSGETGQEVARAICAASYNLSAEPWPSISPAAKDLIRRLLRARPGRRLTAAQALAHPWLREQLASERERASELELDGFCQVAAVAASPVAPATPDPLHATKAASRKAAAAAAAARRPPPLMVPASPRVSSLDTLLPKSSSSSSPPASASSSLASSSYSRCPSGSLPEDISDVSAEVFAFASGESSVRCKEQQQQQQQQEGQRPRSRPLLDAAISGDSSSSGSAGSSSSSISTTSPCSSSSSITSASSHSAAGPEPPHGQVSQDTRAHAPAGAGAAAGSGTSPGADAHAGSGSGSGASQKIRKPSPLVIPCRSPSKHLPALADIAWEQLQLADTCPNSDAATDDISAAAHHAAQAQAAGHCGNGGGTGGGLPSKSPAALDVFHASSHTPWLEKQSPLLASICRFVNPFASPRVSSSSAVAAAPSQKPALTASSSFNEASMRSSNSSSTVPWHALPHSRSQSSKTPRLPKGPRSSFSPSSSSSSSSSSRALPLPLRLDEPSAAQSHSHNHSRSGSRRHSRSSSSSSCSAASSPGGLEEIDVVIVAIPTNQKKAAWAVRAPPPAGWRASLIAALGGGCMGARQKVYDNACEPAPAPAPLLRPSTPQHQHDHHRHQGELSL
eukprot:jgi/Mesen1/8195/ME000044S07462